MTHRLYQSCTLLEAGFDRELHDATIAELREHSYRIAARSPQFDWNDQNTLVTLGPRAARDRRVSRFADC